MNTSRIKRGERCLNCKRELNRQEDNFCPNCGQLNTAQKESAVGLIKELVTEFLHLDSKVLHTLRPLLFQPGRLSLNFNNGLRVRYLHPVRMFLTTTVILFILQSLADRGDKPLTKDIKEFEENKESVIDLTRRIEGTDSLSPDKLKVTWGFGDEKVDNRVVGEFIEQGINDPKVLLDSLDLEPTFFNRLLAAQIIKFSVTTPQELGQYYKKKIPWILFMLMPVFAAILWVLYRKLRPFFVDHLVFAFHLHTALFIMIGFVYLIDILTRHRPSYILLLAPLHYFVSLKTCYTQSWPKTIIKGVIGGILYLIASIFMILIVSAGLLLMF